MKLELKTFKGVAVVGTAVATVVAVAIGCGSIKDGVVGPPITTNVSSKTVTSASAGVTFLEGATQSIGDGEKATFTVAVTSGFLLGTTVVNGTCPQGTWAGLVYTTEAITEDCTVDFLTASATTATVTLTNGSTHQTTTNVTMATAGEHQMFAATAPTVTLYATATVAAPTYKVSDTVTGTCPQGSWDTTGAKYITGALTADCTVIFAVKNPCVTELASDTASWTAVGTIMTSDLSGTTANARVSGCASSGCHGKSGTTKFSVGFFGVGNASANPYSTLIHSTATSGTPTTAQIQAQMYTFVRNGYGAPAMATLTATLPGLAAPTTVCAGTSSTEACTYASSTTTRAGSASITVASDPLNSSLYRKTTTSYLGGRMPSGQTTGDARALTDAEQSTMCNWIWHGALNN